MSCAKICITGPESTGKSTLTKQLANHYNTSSSEEFAREYLDSLDRKHVYSDLELIAKGQLDSQLKAEGISSKIVFLDTDLLTIKIWALDKYQNEITFVNQNLIKHKPDLYLLCYPDLKWKEDSYREDEHRLMEIYNLYLKELKLLGVNFKIIKGQESERLKNSVTLINQIYPQ